MTGVRPGPGTPPRPHADARHGARTPRRSRVLPVALILAGALLLLSTLGVLPAGTWWSLAPLWPLLLIAWGVELVLPESRAWSWSVALASVAVVGGVWLAVRPLTTGVVTPQTIRFDRPAGVEQVDVQLGVGVAHLMLTRGDGAAALLAGDVQLQPGEQLEQQSRQDGTTAVVRLTASSAGPVGTRPGQGATWRLRLVPDVPLTLAVTTGVGRADMDLRGVRVRELHVRMGVGETVLTLPESGPLRASVTGGVGTLTLRVPPNLPLRVRVTPGLGSVTSGPGLTRRGQDYVSAGYDAAPTVRRAEMRITGGVGRVRVDVQP